MNEAQVLDQKAKRLAESFLHTEAEIVAVLIEMKEKRLFTVLNYISVFDYCVNRLKLSNAQASYYLRVVEKAKEVPELVQAIEQGELTLSQARRIEPVITKENHTEWIEKAKSLKQTELEKAVQAVNPRAHVTEKLKPVGKNVNELRVAVDDDTEADLKALKDILSQKLRRPASLSDVVKWMAKEMRHRHDPVRKAERSASSGKLSRERQSEPEPQSQPQSQPRPQPQGRRAIRITTKHAVIRHQGWQCSHVSPDGRRCTQTRWLQFHHIRHVARGGHNSALNLRLLCHAHHSREHVDGRTVRSGAEQEVQAIWSRRDSALAASPLRAEWRSSPR